LTPADLKALLDQAFPGSRVRVEDLTGEGDHYRVEIVSDRFRGRSKIEQHRMVHDAVGERLTREIHALAIRTDVPGQGG
jgi:stress-induced morphogen